MIKVRLHLIENMSIVFFLQLLVFEILPILLVTVWTKLNVTGGKMHFQNADINAHFRILNNLLILIINSKLCNIKNHLRRIN